MRELIVYVTFLTHVVYQMFGKVNFYILLFLKRVTTTVKQRIQDQFIQNWQADINNSSKGVTYKIFKSKFGYEKYFDTYILPPRKILSQFRNLNHHLPVELGRWEGIPLNERFCPLCKKNPV